MIIEKFFNSKPKIFIGFSTEGLLFAEAVERSLLSVAKPTLWSKGVFKSDKMPFDVLSEEILKNDMAVLVASPDDFIKIRGEVQNSMRDNVLFEFGLFTGAFGRQRTFLVMPNTEQFRIPSDITGISHIKYEVNSKDDKKRNELLDEACSNLLLTVNSTIENLRAKKAKNLADNIKHPGCRLLRFISWVRDELTQAQFNNNEDFGKILAFKIQGLSSFLTDEAEALNVKGEFDDLVISLVDALQYFPSRELKRTYSYGHDLLRGNYYFNEYEMEEVLREIRFGEALEAFGRYGGGRDHLIGWLANRNAVLGTFYKRGIIGIPLKPNYHELSEMSAEIAPTLFAWWRLGILEAIAPLRRMREAIRYWEDTYLTTVRKNLDAFEKRLHDNLSL